MKARYYATLFAAGLFTGPAGAQEAPIAALGLTLGASFFALPDIDTGIDYTGVGAFSPDVNGNGVGANLGVSTGISLGTVGDFDAGIGVSAFTTVGTSSNTVVDTFAGPGVVVIGGYTTPDNAGITLATSSAPGNSAASATIIHVNPQGGGELISVDTPVNPAGAVNDYGVTIASGGNSFALGGVVAQQGAVDGAAAYGAVAATDGGVFFGAGDLTGLAVSTNVDRHLIYSGVDLTLAMSTSAGAMSLQGYVGPSYRLLHQSINTTTSVDIPEASPSATSFPLYSTLREETLNSHYWGGVLGFTLSQPVSDTVTFSLGLEGGAYYVRDSYEGQERYSVSGGSLAAVPMTTVNNANGIDLEADGLAWSGKVSPSMTVALAPNRQLTFGGTLDYLSRVATVTRDGSVGSATSSYAGTDDGALTYDGASQTASSLSFGSMWSFTPTVSITGQF